METPLQLDFQGTDVSPALRSLVEERVRDLEARFGRITACRIAIKAPGGHHHTGGLLDVSIHLTLPGGREVAVNRTPQNDERFADPAFAIADAFKRARRQLQDKVRPMQGKVKEPVRPPVGTIARLDHERGFGFLESTDGREIYFHQNSVLKGGFARLEAGDRVSYHETEGEKGPQASTVKPLGKHTGRQ